MILRLGTIYRPEDKVIGFIFILACDLELLASFRYFKAEEFGLDSLLVGLVCSLVLGARALEFIKSILVASLKDTSSRSV